MRQAWIGALLLVVVLAGACTRGSSESFAGDDRTAEQVEISRTTLAEADEAARAYGRAHLGHFLELDGRALRREGLNVPERLELEVLGSHTGYCITVINPVLPSIHPWRIATTGDSGDPSNTDRCRR